MRYYIRRRYNDGVISSLFQKIKERASNLIAVLKHKKNPLYVKVMVIASRIITDAGALITMIGAGGAVRDQIHAFKKVKHANEQLKKIGTVLGTTSIDDMDFEAKRLTAYVTVGVGTLLTVLGELVNRNMMRIARK
jgi:hypothetical protein